MNISGTMQNRPWHTRPFALHASAGLLLLALANAAPGQGGESRTASIKNALQQIATFDFVDTPLKAIALQISNDHKIPISIDLTAIEDMGYRIDQPLTGQANQRPLRTALRGLFRDHELDFVILDDELLITTREAINNNPEKYLSIEVHDITDLRSFGEDQIAELIVKTIDPQAWLDTNGGPQTIQTLKSEKKLLLVISATLENHYRIDELVSTLRTKLKGATESKAKTAGSQPQ